jgi:uncharacterized membrane protein YkoI
MSKRWALVALLALGAGCAHNMNNHDEEGEEANEVKMTLDQVPAPVRATLTREANGATIKTVDKEEQHGQTIYETDVMSGGKNWEIKVDENGKLISKKLDNEEEEKASQKKGEKEDDDEKEEKAKH